LNSLKTRIVARICSFALFLGALAACQGKPKGTPGEDPYDGRPDQTLGKFSMDSFQGVDRQWVLVSPHADIYDREHRVDLETPDVQFFTEGKHSSTVSAAQGRLDSESKNFWAGGGVVMVSTEGVRLESDWVTYEKATDRFSSTAPVTVTRGRSVVYGVGWEGKSDLSDLVIRNQRGEIAPEDNQVFKNK
jgi:LPS export ABC transporter protein LptC